MANLLIRGPTSECAIRPTTVSCSPIVFATKDRACKKEKKTCTVYKIRARTCAHIKEIIYFRLVRVATLKQTKRVNGNTLKLYFCSKSC